MDLLRISMGTTRGPEHDFDSLRFQLCFLNRYVIGISGSLTLAKIIELDSFFFFCNFTSALAYLITLVFFSAPCSLEQIQKPPHLCKVTAFCTLEFL